MSKKRPQLTIKRILAWADAYYVRRGLWPTTRLFVVRDAPNETWPDIDEALVSGRRGLTGGSSLDKLLARHRNLIRRDRPRRLTLKQILAWADNHRKRTGKWPTSLSGTVLSVPNEHWRLIDDALRLGRRELTPGSSLAKLLVKHRSKPNIRELPPLTVKGILRWADAHHRRTGNWPKAEVVTVHGVPGVTWNMINAALMRGTRGLRGGSTLGKVLAEQRNVRIRKHLPRLTIKQILLWADDHCRLTGRWPNRNDGPVGGAPGETWAGISMCLITGRRGLSPGSTLTKVFRKHRSAQRQYLRWKPTLTTHEIVAWANRHRRRTGKRPNTVTGAVSGHADESWSAIDAALRIGGRGLPAGLSLSKLLDWTAQGATRTKAKTVKTVSRQSMRRRQ